MKLLKYISVLPALLLTLVACSSDLDKTYFNPEDVTASSLDAVAESYVLDTNNPDEVLDTLSWGKMDFGYPAAVTYTVEVDKADNDFKTAQAVTAVSNIRAEIVSKSLNAAVLKVLKANEISFGEGDKLTIGVEFRIRASISDAVAPVYSLNAQASKVTPFYVAEFPEEVFMVGAQFGDWGWDNEGVVDLVPVNGKAGMFWTVKYVEAGKGFKFNSIKDWDGSFGLLKTNIGVTEDGGNAVVAESGFYTIFVDLKNETLAVEPAEVYGIGGAFGGWNMGDYPFVAQDQKMTITTTKADELRMCATGAYAKSLGIDWWRMEFMILAGKIEYRGKGGDQERVNVVEGQKVTLDFNAETGVIE